MHHQESGLGVLVLTTNPILAELPEILTSAGFTAVGVTSMDDFAKLSEPSQCCLVVMDDLLDESSRVRALAHVRNAPSFGMLRLTPAVGLVASRTTVDSDIIEELVVGPVTSEVLLHRVRAIFVRLGYSLPADSGSAAPQRNKGSKSVAIYSMKGGVGKSTIAVNLAVGLTRLPDARVLLIDADLAGGDVGVLLDVKGRHSLYDVCVRQINEPESLARIVTPHSSGLSILLRPPDLAMLESLDTSGVANVLPGCSTLYDHIVVNMSSSLDELNLSILDAVDRILLVTTPEVPAIHNAHRFLEIAHRLGYTKKMSLLLNRAESGVDLDSLEKSLKLPVAARIASAGRMMVEAANQGKSVFAVDPQFRQEVTRNFLELVEMMAGRRVQRQAKRTGPSFLFSRRAA